MRPERTSIVTELLAGLAASAVILPQAMAFGVALFLPFSDQLGQAALAGLVGAAALCFCSGVLGGTRGLITAPSGPVVVLLGGTLAAMSASGLDYAAILTGLAVMLALTGLFQAGIGLVGGGSLIKFIPYPVVAGFMTGSALLMILSQVKVLAGASSDGLVMMLIPVLTAAVTFFAMSYSPRLLPAIPGTIAGLLLGTAAFHALGLLASGATPDNWVIGALPDPRSMELGFSLDALGEVPWGILLPAAVALSVLASLDTLLTSVIADVNTGARHKARIELLGQGLGQITAGLLGGIGGAGTTGATMVAVQTGGRRWVGVFAALTFVALVLFMGPVGAYLPVAALAGIILRVAVNMLDFDVIAWARRQSTRMDSIIALLVTGVTVVYDLMTAVGVGVAIAILLFVEAQFRAPIIHRRSTAAETRSVCKRPLAERELLDEHGDRIVVYELRGSLFFASADRLYEAIVADLERPAWVILHMRRVSGVDLTSQKILEQMSRRLQVSGGELLFCNIHSLLGLEDDVSETLHKLSPGQAASPVRTFIGLDEALEYAEGALLKNLGVAEHEEGSEYPLERMDLFRGLSPEELDAVRGRLKEVTIERGEVIFRRGDDGSSLYLIASGEVDILLHTSETRHKRLAKCGPGSVFGEIAFIEKGPRAADAVCVQTTRLYKMERAALEELFREHPETGFKLLIAMTSTMANYLRWSARELQRLAQW